MSSKTIADWQRGEELGILSASVAQTMPETWNRFRVDPVAYLEARHALEYDQPQAQWTNGCPMGNGDLGAMTYGPPEATLFSLGKTDLWDYRPYGEARHPPADFTTWRRELAAGNADFFDEQVAALQGNPGPQITAKPGGMLRLELFSAAIARNFTQRLSFAHAETVQSWIPAGNYSKSATGGHGGSHAVTLTSFVHAARNVLVAQVQPGEAVGWHGDIRFTLWREHDPDMPPPECRIDGTRAWVRQELPGGEYFVLMGTVDDGGFTLSEVNGQIHGIGSPATPTATFYVTLVTSRDCADPLAQAHANLNEALALGFDILRETHRRWWHNYWRRAYVCVPWTLVERKWYEALYQQACICRPGRLTPGLQGNWVKENYPAWNADFHNNINMQILYWGQYTANRLELGEPFYRLLAEVLPRVEADTAAYFKMRGARFPISMGTDGVETAANSLCTYIGAGGWLAQHLWWHYRYSGDRDFLRDYAYPVLKACALFYEDYLQEDADGRLYLFPTIHMEVDIARIDGFGKNSVWDLPVVIRTFQMAADAARELGIDTDAQARWEAFLPRLSPIPADEQGVWLEFADKGGLWHIWDWTRFMPLFPMELVGSDAGPEELRRQARATIEEYYNYRSNPDEVGGFAGVMQAVALMRMGDAERALRMAQYCCDEMSLSGFITSRNAFYLQVDVSPGLSVLLSEMLLQSFDGILRIFPAAPANDEPVRFHSLRAQGGFLMTAERRGATVPYVLIHSLHGNPVRLRNPFVNEPDRGVQVKVYELSEGMAFATTEEQGSLRPCLDHIYLPDTLIEFPTQAGKTYLVSKEIPWFSTVVVEDVTP
ncbi:MAG: glycosyl hydrolase family 95 catalytic domain-containing protein [Armatimonadota bacterium]